LIRVPYRGDHEDPQALLDAARAHAARLIYLANPDNPMGSYHPAAVIEDMIANLPDHSLLLLDEAYSDLAPPDTIPDIPADHPQVIRLRTFSKGYGMAGARVGYAITHPDRVKGLVLRGIFLCRPSEIEWLYQQGAHRLYPDAWENYLAPIPVAEHGDLVKAYYQRLTSLDAAVRVEAAKAWSVWEAATSKLIPDTQLMEDFEEDEFALAFARIECHYFSHNSFFATDNYLLENVEKIRHIPCRMVHGRYDVVCPVISAWDLKKAYPEAHLTIIPDAGHSAMEPGILHELIHSTQLFRSLWD
jgi:proline iminopeptidase